MFIFFLYIFKLGAYCSDGTTGIQSKSAIGDTIIQIIQTIGDKLKDAVTGVQQFVQNTFHSKTHGKNSH